jgi:hypothetical protein
MIQMEICLKQSKISRQDHPGQVFRSQFHLDEISQFLKLLETGPERKQKSRNSKTGCPETLESIDWNRLWTKMMNDRRHETRQEQASEIQLGN